MSALRQTPLTCSGHTRPVVYLAFSDITPFGYFLISACKGITSDNFHSRKDKKYCICQRCRFYFTVKSNARMSLTTFESFHPNTSFYSDSCLYL